MAHRRHSPPCPTASATRCRARPMRSPPNYKPRSSKSSPAACSTRKAARWRARSPPRWTNSSADVSVTVATGDIPYATIHEYGGTIPPHEIVPDKAKALAFILAGKQAFAARVNLPAIAMPERSYMRSSLAEMADEIGEELGEVVAGAIN